MLAPRASGAAAGEATGADEGDGDAAGVSEGVGEAGLVVSPPRPQAVASRSARARAATGFSTPEVWRTKRTG